MDLPIRSRTFDDDADLDFALNQLGQSTEDDVDEQYDLQDSQNRQMREKWDSIMKEIEKECKKSAPNRQWEPLILKMRDEESYKDALRGTCNGTGFLYHFVKDIHIARNCPREVATVIVNHNPDSVEHVIDGGDQHPLTFAIKTSCDNLFLSMLTSLLQRGISLLKNDKGEGRQCIRAAFEALRQRCHSLMTIAACKLVGWASESMLSGLKTGLSLKLTSRRVRVALIDDGVDVFTSDLARFSDRFFPGVSFDRLNDRHSSREWSSRGGYGTLMAKLILAVCPHADIVTYRVLMRLDHENNLLIPDAESAAKVKTLFNIRRGTYWEIGHANLETSKAIKHAVKRGVDIISMSWTISKPGQGTDKSGYDRLKNVMAEAARESASAPVPLLFCAAADDGPGGSNDDEELPSAMSYSKLICIGAATSTGQTWLKVSNANDRQYFFPGVDIPDLRKNFQYNYESPDTDPFVNLGSSIACALAVGQAALILHCVKLGVYYTKKKEKHQVEIITEDDLDRMKEYEHMRKAFDALCSQNLSQHKVSYPTQGFEKTMDQMQKLEDQGMLDSLAGLEPIVRLVRGLIGQRPH
ncbi:hypothetical protein H9Q71_007307 [Fusarium xylarioides]|nr:hypothetical protein H9Q71_007307 [Fusarium xylarioides]